MQHKVGSSHWGLARTRIWSSTCMRMEIHFRTRMLARMAGAEDGIRDALTRYTTAVSGAYYFVPSVEALRGFAPADDE